MADTVRQHSKPGDTTPTPMHSFTAPAPGSPGTVGGWAGNLNNEKQIHNAFTGEDFQPDPTKPPEAYDRYKDNANITRSKEEEKTPLVHPEGMATGAILPYPAEQTGRQIVDSNPGSRPELVSRPMRHPAAGAFRFMREFGQQVSHYFTGVHLSGADPQSIRAASVAMLGGMQPARQVRNTYRIAPPLAETLQVDEPIPVTVTGNPYPDTEYVPRNRSWRLG